MGEKEVTYGYIKTPGRTKPYVKTKKVKQKAKGRNPFSAFEGAKSIKAHRARQKRALEETK